MNIIEGEKTTTYHCPVRACPANPERGGRLCGYVAGGMSCGHPKWRSEFLEALRPYRAMADFLQRLNKPNWYKLMNRTAQEYREQFLGSWE